jgi:GDPmannose 4,6-dehydratase
MATALITGITGQDGSYLAELLLSKGYKVTGLVRRSTGNFERISHIKDKLTLVEADMLQQDSLMRALEETAPDEVYNFASRSSVSRSWADPVLTAEVNGLGVSRLLEAIRCVKPGIRFYEASSSEIFGSAATSPQDELTPIRPCNPYGVAKAYAHFITVAYRESYGMFAVCGIFFNHESPRRGPEFVTRKISRGVASIMLGLETELRLGNLNVTRDWGFAADYVQAAWMMLQQRQPEDCVIGTGEAHSVEDFVKEAFGYVHLDWKEFVRVDPQFKSRGDIESLVANPSRAFAKLGWRPRVSFEELVHIMVDADLEDLRLRLNTSSEITTRSVE